MNSADSIAQVRIRLSGLMSWDRAFLASILLCCLSVLTCFYVAVSVPTHLHSVAVNRLFLSLKQEHLTSKSKDESTDAVSFATTSDVLKKLQTIASHNGVTIERAVSNGESPTDVHVSLFGNYAAINRFVRATEALDLTIGMSSLTLADPSGQSPRINAQLDLNRSAHFSPAPAKQIIWSLGNLKKIEDNDPFARHKKSADQMAGDGFRDLTWAYRLSGLSEISGVHFATVDNQDFSIGDRIDNMTITKIDKSGVFLTAEQGEPCVIRFRQPILTQHSSL